MPEPASNEADAIKARLDAGEWLGPNDIAKLFGTHRSTVSRWLTRGVRLAGKPFKIGYRESPGGWREADPADIRVLFAAVRQRRTADDPQPKPPTAGHEPPPASSPESGPAAP